MIVNWYRIPESRNEDTLNLWVGTFLLAVRAGKIRGQDCATCLIGWFASGGPAGKSEAGAKRQGGILTELGLPHVRDLQQEKLLVTFGYKSYSRKKLNTSKVKCHQ